MCEIRRPYPCGRQLPGCHKRSHTRVCQPRTHISTTLSPYEYGYHSRELQKEEAGTKKETRIEAGLFVVELNSLA